MLPLESVNHAMSVAANYGFRARTAGTGGGVGAGHR